MGYRCVSPSMCGMHQLNNAPTFLWGTGHMVDSRCTRDHTDTARIPSTAPRDITSVRASTFVYATAHTHATLVRRMHAHDPRWRTPPVVLPYPRPVLHVRPLREARPLLDHYWPIRNRAAPIVPWRIPPIPGSTIRAVWSRELGSRFRIHQNYARNGYAGGMGAVFRYPGGLVVGEDGQGRQGAEGAFRGRVGCVCSQDTVSCCTLSLLAEENVHAWARI